MRLKRSDRGDRSLFIQKDLSLICKDDSGIRIFLRCVYSNTDPALIRIKSDHYDVTVPTARVRALDQKGHEEKDLPEDSSDTRVFLTDQSVLSLALETIRNGVMEGRSSAVGKVRIPLQSVRKVQFNLQNPELRKQRETPFRCK